jgi:pimeloyl-ACP methyl ester carboxylesterase
MRYPKIIAAFVCMLILVTACRLYSIAPTVSPTNPIPVDPSATPAKLSRGDDTTAILERLGGYPCPDSSFTCVKLSVPLDHFNADNGKTIDVVFAVLPAAGERRGMFITANGGPGASGLLSADSYTSYFQPALTEHFDIVFFDQRGVGASGGLQCPLAAAAYYLTTIDATTPAGETSLAASAETFSRDCVTEMGNPEILPFLGTAQAVEDLEAFRQAIGDDTFWLYGESYGTQFSQTYAAVHPEHLAGLILDGTVDLTLSGTDFLAMQAAAFDNSLAMTLQACNADPVCAQALDGDAAATYNQLAAELAATPLPFTFPLPSGSMAMRTFSIGDLESAASGYLYSESERMLFLRALAVYVRNGDLAPLARVLYDALSIDPETLVGIADPSFSDAVYYAVECQDYSYFTGTPAERAAAYLRAGDQVDASLKRFSSIFYGDFPCVFWPNASQSQTRPAYLSLENVPTLVLGATADPATPLSNGISVYQHLADGYMITEQGGPHVIFGWGNACPDDLVTTFLVDGTLPDQRETTCDGVVTSEYVPLAPINASDFANPLKALNAAYTEIYYLPEYYYWDVTTPTTVGCPFGGMLTFEPSDLGDAFTLTECAFSDGFKMTGSGVYNYDQDSFSLDVNVTGLAQGVLHYSHQGNGSILATGSYANQTIDLKDTGK